MKFQITATLLEACVMSLLGDGPAYGYIITQRLQDKVECSESTLYPVLRRLEKDGLLTSYNREANGRNRKFYKLTEEGCLQLADMRREWERYKALVDNLIGKEVGT